MPSKRAIYALTIADFGRSIVVVDWDHSTAAASSGRNTVDLRHIAAYTRVKFTRVNAILSKFDIA